MKKTKIILPLVAITGSVATIAPLVCLTSCNKNATLTTLEIAKYAVGALSGRATSELLNNAANGLIDPATALKQVDVLIENLGDDAVTATSVASTDPDYKNRLNVTFKLKDLSYQKQFTLFYNDVTSKLKEKYTEIEIKTGFAGKCVIDSQSLPFEVMLEKEFEVGETETETKFKLYDDSTLTSGIEIKHEHEVKTTKEEDEFKTKKFYLGYEDETSIKLVRKTGQKLKVKIEREIESDTKEKCYFIRNESATTISYDQYNDDDFISKLYTWTRTIKEGEIVYIQS